VDNEIIQQSSTTVLLVTASQPTLINNIHHM